MVFGMFHEKFRNAAISSDSFIYKGDCKKSGKVIQ